MRVGQRFRKRDTLPSVWEVVAIAAPRDAIAHARLIRSGDPFDVKIVSLITLADPNYYQLVTDR